MLYIIMCKENCADDANVNNIVETLLREIQGLRSELNDLRTGLEASKIKLVPDAIYNNKEIRLLLNVDERLIKKYRDNGYLSFYRRDDKYWYRGKDVLDFLNRCHYQAFA